MILVWDCSRESDVKNDMAVSDPLNTYNVQVVMLVYLGRDLGSYPVVTLLTT